MTDENLGAGRAWGKPATKKLQIAMELYRGKSVQVIGRADVVDVRVLCPGSEVAALLAAEVAYNDATVGRRGGGKRGGG